MNDRRSGGWTEGHRLLIDESPLQVLPGLALALGLNEAMILQQLHYWTQRSSHEHEGHRWVYNTTKEWQAQFPFWSEATIKRAFASLRERGIVAVAKLASDVRDRTNWYRIDYEALAGIDGGRLAPGADCTHDEVNLSPSNIGSDCADGVGHSDPVLIDRAETTAETTSRRGKRPPTQEPMGFEDWLAHHCEVTGQRVPGASTAARAKLAAKFATLVGEGRSLEEMKLASVGAHSDEWLREKALTFPRNVLVADRIDELIEKGRRTIRRPAASSSGGSSRFERRGPRRDI